MKTKASKTERHLVRNDRSNKHPKYVRLEAHFKSLQLDKGFAFTLNRLQPQDLQAILELINSVDQLSDNLVHLVIEGTSSSVTSASCGT